MCTCALVCVGLVISLDVSSMLIDGVYSRGSAYLRVHFSVASESGMLYQYNKLVGGVLITQKRGRQEECKVSSYPPNVHPTF